MKPKKYLTMKVIINIKDTNELAFSAGRVVSINNKKHPSFKVVISSKKGIANSLRYMFNWPNLRLYNCTTRKVEHTQSICI